MIQKNIREWEGREYSANEGATIFKELNDRTASGINGYNSIEELGIKVQELESSISGPVSTITIVEKSVTKNEMVTISNNERIFMIQLMDGTDEGKVTFPSFTTSEDGTEAYLNFDWDIPNAQFKIMTEGSTQQFTNSITQSREIVEDQNVIITSEKPIFLIQVVDSSDGGKRFYPEFTLSIDGLTATFFVSWNISNASIKLITE